MNGVSAVRAGARAGRKHPGAVRRAALGRGHGPRWTMAADRGRDGVSGDIRPWRMDFSRLRASHPWGRSCLARAHRRGLMTLSRRSASSGSRPGAARVCHGSGPLVSRSRSRVIRGALVVAASVAFSLRERSALTRSLSHARSLSVSIRCLSSLGPDALSQRALSPSQRVFRVSPSSGASSHPSRAGRALIAGRLSASN